MTNTLPLIFAFIAMAVLTGMDGVVKGLSASHATLDIVALRYATGAVWAIALALALRPAWPSNALMRIHATRAIFSIFSAGLFFYGIAVLPFAVAVAIGFLSPAVTALMARVFLGEPVKPLTIASMAVSFAGVLVIAYDRARSGVAAPGGDFLGIAATLVSVVAYSGSLVLLRARAQKDEMAVIVLLTNVFAACYLAVASLLVSNPVAAMARDGPLFFLIGGLGTLGHVFLSWAYARASAARVVAVDYTSFLWAIAIGMVFFGEFPTPVALAGAALIIAGSLLLINDKKPAPALVEE